MISINYWAVLVAAIAQMVLGALWYGPLFGKPWMRMTAAKAEGGAGKSYGLMFVGALLMAWVLAHAIAYAGSYIFAATGWYGACAGIMVGFMNWLGFIAPVTLGPVLWEGKPWKLWALNAGYYLVGLCIMGAILAAWM